MTSLVLGVIPKGGMMTLVPTVVVVLFFVFVVTANLLTWNRIVAEDSGTSSWLKKHLPGINVLAIVGAAFFLGGLTWQMSTLRTDFSKQFDDMRTEMKAELDVLNNEVYRNPDSLKIQTALMKADLEHVRPRVIREDFDKRIADLTGQLAQLQQDNEQLRQQLTQLNQELEKLRQENQGLQEQLSRYR